jgi:hypothetical protein
MSWWLNFLVLVAAAQSSSIIWLVIAPSPHLTARTRWGEPFSSQGASLCTSSKHSYEYFFHPWKGRDIREEPHSSALFLVVSQKWDTFCYHPTEKFWKHQATLWLLVHHQYSRHFNQQAGSSAVCLLLFWKLFCCTNSFMTKITYCSFIDHTTLSSTNHNL